MTEYKTENKICFIDSNIWLYAFIISKDNKSTIARSVIMNNDIVISAQVINEVCINLIKKANFLEKEVRELIDSFYDKYSIIEFRKEIMDEASVIREKHSFSFWDSLIMSSAVNSEAEILYSEDMHHGFIFKKTKIVNPFK